MIAYLLSLNKEADITKQWDFGLLKDTLQDIGAEMQSCVSLPKAERGIVVLPARHHKTIESKVNKELQKLDHVVLFLMGDEEADFDISKIQHKSIHIWVQNPHIGKHDDYNKIGTGYPQHLSDMKVEQLEKDIEVFFAGQVTHNRRVELSEALDLMEAAIPGSVMRYESQGFTQGLEPKDYYSKMARTKVAPCPSGAVIPDSFRLFEALECMCLVVADNKTPAGDEMEYWDWLFDQIVPFPKLTNWYNIKELYKELMENYPTNLHHQTAWYLRWKRQLRHKILEQYNG